ncbi:MAG: hypothetical protein Q8K75_02800 [Chlamydiales bacterium]|nr:hypothetical protein [Chlamydiales bacterium]
MESSSNVYRPLPPLPSPPPVPARNEPPPVPPRAHHAELPAFSQQEEIPAMVRSAPAGAVPNHPVKLDRPKLERVTYVLLRLASGAVKGVQHVISAFRSPPPPPPVKIDPMEHEDLEELGKMVREANIPEESFRENIPDRTRNDIVQYAQQLSTAGASGLDRTAADVMQAVEGLPDDAKMAVFREYAQGLQDIENKMSSLDQIPQFSGVSQDVIDALKSDNPDVALGAKAVLSNALRQPVSSDQKQFLGEAKHELQNLEKEYEGLCKNVVARARSEAADANLLTPELDSKLTKIEGSALAFIGNARVEMIHAREEWNTNVVTSFDVEVTNRAGDPMVIGSTFRAAGPPYSSILPRNRVAEDTVVPNFFETSIKVPGLEKAPTATRSAIPVEFGLDDPQERAEATQANVKQILDHHTAALISKMDTEEMEVGSEDAPIVLKYQHLMLLTADKVRDIASADPSLVYRADNERLLVNESYQANQFWNDSTKDKPQLVSVVVNGVPRKVWIKYDIRTFNVPSNKYQESSISNAVKRMNVQHKLTDQMNQNSLSQLKGDIDEMKPKLQAQMDAMVLPAGDKEKLQSLTQMIAVKRKLRDQISDSVLNDKPIKPELLAEWTATADTVTKKSQTMYEQLSEDGKKYLDGLNQMESITDVYTDLNELISKRGYMDVAMQDGNRYSIGSRILLLSSLLDQASHFGCRSGKDRTGIQDDDFKLLMAETAAEGRVPSYLEIEKWKAHQENRTQMHDQSGNAEFNPRANLGGFAWWNVGGARLTPKEASLAEERTMQYDSKQSANAIFWRPKITKT